MALVVVSNLSYVLFGLVVLAIGFAKLWKARESGEAPGPFRWPIIGNLHLLRGFKVPYQAFNHLAAKYGSVYSLQMGSVPAVVVQGADNIRQVLIQKGHHFDSRPNFDRYHRLFHGNKENSLAFCDWSDLQKRRRDMLKDHTFPKVYMDNYNQLDRLVCEEFKKLIRDIKDSAGGAAGRGKGCLNKREPKSCRKALPKALRRLMENRHVETIIRFPHYLKSAAESKSPMPDSGKANPVVDIKRKLSLAIGNIFLRYFCSTDLRGDRGLADFVRNFDEIFYEVNQGYAFDFLPFLSVFHRKQIEKAQGNSSRIRKFMLSKVVGNRLDRMQEGDAEKDYLDALLKAVKFRSANDVKIDLETALFSLEDIIGGHSAIANFLVKLVQFLVGNKEVQTKIKEEADRLQKRFITLSDRCLMPYTEATVMETLRLLSSPIVPHVANQDTSIAGYTVKKDTLIFLNNYELNMSQALWKNPNDFDPSRFIDPATGSKAKPSHFMPFGGGKRSCMGYKLVQFLSFVFVANAVGNFSIDSAPGEKCGEVSTGNLALPPTESYKFEFKVR